MTVRRTRLIKIYLISLKFREKGARDVYTRCMIVLDDPRWNKLK